MKIKKYTLKMISTEQTIPMPKEAKILCVQDDIPVLWTLIDEFQPTEGRVFCLHPAGYSNENLKKEIYLGMCKISTTIWHVFEVPLPIDRGPVIGDPVS